MPIGSARKPVTVFTTWKSIPLTIVRAFSRGCTVRMSSPSGCQEMDAGPGATRVSEIFWWKVGLVGSTSMNATVPEEKLLTAMRRRFGANARSTGSEVRIVSRIVIRLLLTTRICLLSPSRT